MNRPFSYAVLFFLTTLLSSCELIGDIFKAGFGLGVFVVLAIIILILFFVFKRRG